MGCNETYLVVVADVHFCLCLHPYVALFTLDLEVWLLTVYVDFQLVYITTIHVVGKTDAYCSSVKKIWTGYTGKQRKGEFCVTKALHKAINTIFLQL